MFIDSNKINIDTKKIRALRPNYEKLLKSLDLHFAYLSRFKTAISFSVFNSHFFLIAIFEM